MHEHTNTHSYTLHVPSDTQAHTYSYPNSLFFSSFPQSHTHSNTQWQKKKKHTQSIWLLQAKVLWSTEQPRVLHYWVKAGKCATAPTEAVMNFTLDLNFTSSCRYRAVRRCNHQPNQKEYLQTREEPKSTNHNSYLYSRSAGLPVAQKMSRMGDKASSYQAPVLWNTLHCS